MEYTDKALELIENESWYDAQSMLKSGVENMPGCESYNNMGVFYIDNGIQHKDKESTEAGELGYKYLKMAEHCDINYKNLVAIAEYNYYYGDCNVACKYFKKTSELVDDYRVYNNLGCGCYKLGGYIKAAMYFDKALKRADKNIDDIKISYCYALLKCNEDFSEIFATISDEKWTVLDRFILLYLSGDLKNAYKLVDSVIGEWQFDLSVLAMLYDCVEENNIADLSKFDDEIKKLVNNRSKRQEIIKEYKYTPVMLWQCKYIGCEKH